MFAWWVLATAVVVGLGVTWGLGVVVFAFQDGHLAGLLDFTSTGFLEPTNRTGDNAAAAAGGLQRTGGIITAAALLPVVVIAGFSTGGTAAIKQLGVGAIVAILIDALRLPGRWNWWAPGPLARVYRRYGLREESAERARAGERVRA